MKPRLDRITCQYEAKRVVFTLPQRFSEQKDRPPFLSFLARLLKNPMVSQPLPSSGAMLKRIREVLEGRTMAAAA